MNVFFRKKLCNSRIFGIESNFGKSNFSINSTLSLFSSACNATSSIIKDKTIGFSTIHAFSIFYYFYKVSSTPITVRIVIFHFYITPPLRNLFVLLESDFNQANRKCQYLLVITGGCVIHCHICYVKICHLF